MGVDFCIEDEQIRLTKISKAGFCKCGCGSRVKLGRRFVNNHNIIFLHTFSEEIKRKISLSHRGKKLSKEHVAKIQVTRKGYMHSEETKKKMSASHSGKILSIGHKLKLSKAKMGKKRGPQSEDHRRKIGEANSGCQHWNWKGGIAYEPYCEIWGDKEYRESIKERDNYQCQNPGCSHRVTSLVVHHIDYVKKNCHPLNLITLCRSCNVQANVRREMWESFYSEIMQHKFQHQREELVI